jgi:hypothetical protein
MASNPSAVSLSIPCASAHGEPMFVSIEVHSFSIPFMSAMGLYYAMLCGSFLFGLYKRHVALLHHSRGV